MRDTLMSKEHWDKRFRYFDDAISFEESLIENTIAKQGEDSEGARRAYSLHLASCISYMNTLYSSGSSLEEIKIIYPKIVNLFKKAWNKSSRYVEMVWMLSIGIMLNVEQKYILELSELVKRDNLDDFLINYLIHQAVPSWPAEKVEFQFEDPYGLLLPVIEATTEDERQEVLKNYINKKWYKGHRDMGWHGIHKDKNSLYNGYWSYESGAIAKILKLDDTGWEGMKYYPYDMVHYNG